jgi:hypothetical protein
MATSANDILKQALELDEPDRARLVTELLGTLEPEGASRSLTDLEWIAEIERRARAALAGDRVFPGTRRVDESKMVSVVNGRSPACIRSSR